VLIEILGIALQLLVGLFERPKSGQVARLRSIGLSLLAVAVGSLVFIVVTDAHPASLPVVILITSIGAIVLGAVCAIMNASLAGRRLGERLH
jgi:hypothetical protein